jgi:hypothetical protein
LTIRTINRLRINNNERKILSGRLNGAMESQLLDNKTKFIAWAIFLFLFIESGTLGLIPQQFYFVYRNMRLSDFILYFLVAYSFINIKDYSVLYHNKSVLIVKLLLLYLSFQFFISVILYQQNIIEYFFRLKSLWISFIILPLMHLINRKGLPYLIRIMLPVAVLSNVLYILS